MIGIYKITNPEGQVYIGQSKNLRIRRQSHIKTYGFKETSRIGESMNKYGFSSHVFEVIEECFICELDEKERYYQELYNAIGPNGLNQKLTKTDTKPSVRSLFFKTPHHKTLLDLNTGVYYETLKDALKYNKRSKIGINKSIALI